MTLREEFEAAWPLLKPAIAAYGDTHRKRHVLEMIEDGRAVLFRCPGSAMVIEINTWPTGLKEAVAWLAGGDLEGIRKMTPEIEAWARRAGCHRAAVNAGRLGWTKVLKGYRERGVFLTKDL